jgi:hypothetical protein
MNSKTRFIAGYVAGYILVLPFALVALLPKVIVRHIKAARLSADVAYNSQHIQPCCGIVAEMADGTMRYVEDPFPVDIQ